jgi:hypothetical protein
LAKAAATAMPILPAALVISTTGFSMEASISTVPSAAYLARLIITRTDKSLARRAAHVADRAASQPTFEYPPKCRIVKIGEAAPFVPRLLHPPDSGMISSP